MSEKHTIWVNYDTSETDLSCVVCIEHDNSRDKMLVGYIDNDADEVYKIVSEQGYLNKHDEEIRAYERVKTIDVAEKLLDKNAPDKVAEIKCEDGEIRNRPLIDIARIYEIFEQMKGNKE